MKTRQSFVSNSSSSSFIIAKCYLTESQIQAIKSWHAELKANGEYFGEHGDYLEEDENYIGCETHNVYTSFNEMVEKNKIPKSKMFRIDG